MIHWPLPSPGHGVVKTRETRPETFKAKASYSPRGLRVSRQQWAGIRASRQCRHQRVLGVEVLPFQIAEKLIDADQSGARADLTLGIVAEEYVEISEVEEIGRILDYDRSVSS